MSKLIRLFLAALVASVPAAVAPVVWTGVNAQTVQAPQSVSWSEIVNCAVNANSLQKTGGRDDGYDAGAVSAQEISAGDAFLEFTAGDPNKALFCGLGHQSIGTDFEDIDFAVKLTTYGAAEIRENNAYRTETSYSAQDVFRIAIQGGVVSYYKNGGFLYASAKAPILPLRVDAALCSMGARVVDANIGALSLGTPADWKMYQHDEGHSGYSTASVVSTSNAASLTQSWAFHTGDWVTGTPVVSGGTVYVGSWDGRMYALRESDGAVIWSYDSGTIHVDSCQTTYGIDSTAALSGGRLYFGTGQSQLHALNAATGQLIWKSQLADPNLAFHMWGSPLVFDGKVYIGLASHCVNPCVTGRLVCVDANDGRVIWSFATAPDGSTGGAVWSSVAVDTGRRMVYVGTGNYCTGADTHSTAVIALNSDTGALVWEFKKLHADLNNLDFGASPVLFDIDGKAALAIPCKDGHCYALHRQTGELIWDSVITDGDSRGGSISSPAAAYGKIFLGGTVQVSTGKVVALDQRDGHIVWQAPLAKPVLGAAAVAGGAVFMGSDDGALHAFDASNGAELWSARRSSMWGGVSISRDKVFVGSVDHNVYAFSLPGATPGPSLSIVAISPKAADVWPVKSKQDITWNASAGIGKVDVSISRDGGQTWTTLASGLDASTGTFRLKIKKPRSEAAMIKVVDSADQTVFGLTGLFEIR